MDFDEEFADPIVAQRLREAYTGRHEVTDAVWWRSHPLDPGPSGAPSPAAEAARLARLVFSRDGADSATVVAHAAAESQLDSDRRDIDEAIARARDAEPPAGPVEPVHAPEPPAESDADSHPAAPPRLSKRVAILVVTVVVAALVVGVWAGTQVSASPRPGTLSYSGSFEPLSINSTLGAESDAPESNAPVSPALGVFNRAQIISSGADSDVPTLSSDAYPEFELDSFRRMVDMVAFPSEPSTGSADEPAPLATIYAVRTNANRACIIAVHDGHLLGSACAVEAYFPLTGLQLMFVSNGARYTLDWVSSTIDGWQSGPA